VQDYLKSAFFEAGWGSRIRTGPHRAGHLPSRRRL